MNRYELLVRLRSVGGRAVWTDDIQVGLDCGDAGVATITWENLELMVGELEELDQPRLRNNN